MRCLRRHGERSGFAQFTLLIKTKNRAGTVDDFPAEYVVGGQNASSCSFQNVSVEGLSDQGSPGRGNPVPAGPFRSGLGGELGGA